MRDYVRVFDDKGVLNEMLRAYEEGLNFTALGERFKVDHTSIMYQVKKAGLWVPGRRNPPRVHLKRVKPPRVISEEELRAQSHKRCNRCGILFKSRFAMGNDGLYCFVCIYEKRTGHKVLLSEYAKILQLGRGSE